MARAITLSRRGLARLTVGLTVAGLAATFSIAQASGVFAGGSPARPAKPTVVLVHGAWADASGWSGEIRMLQHDGYPVVAVPNELRSLSGDAANVAAFLKTVKSPIILVGHSYGGAVITNAANGISNVRALVYIDAFAPDQGQSAVQLAGMQSALSAADPTTVFTFVPAGPPTPATDLFLKTPVFLKSFANGLPESQARILAASQRPATLGAITEPSGVPAWRTIPSWYLIGTQDRIIPPAAERTMAEHAGAKISYFKAGHLGLISDPKSVTRVIERAATATQ
jgi:pimeloyl-ACP methyl ester carboxylesterase